MEDKHGWQIVEQCLEQADGPAWTVFLERFEPPLRWGIHRALRGLGVEGDRRDLAADWIREQVESYKTRQVAKFWRNRSVNRSGEDPLCRLVITLRQTGNP